MGVEVNGKTLTVTRGSWLGLIHNSNTVYAHICCFLGSKKDFLPSFHGNFLNL